MNRLQFFDSIPALSQTNRQRIQWAYAVAKRWHDGQTRDSGERYFEHVRAVALVLVEYGYTDADYIIIAMLHDALEDTSISVSMIEQLFGPDIARDVLTLSKVYGIEDPLTGFVTPSAKREKPTYFEAIERRGKRVVIVKSADRCHNLTDLATGNASSRWTPEKQLAQAEETRTWILPLTVMHDPRLAEKLEDLCTLIETKARQERLGA